MSSGLAAEQRCCWKAVPVTLWVCIWYTVTLDYSSDSSGQQLRRLPIKGDHHVTDKASQLRQFFRLWKAYTSSTPNGWLIHI